MRILNEYKIGSYTGDGAAQSISCGFKPVFVLVWNETDGDTLWAHIQGMTDANAIKIALAVAAQTSNAITLSSTGFTIGTDVSESAKVFRYIAF